VRAGERRHREEHPVVFAGAVVVAFDCHRARQHDIGVAGGGRPERIVHYHRLRARESRTQAGQVLMVMERVAAAPIDQLDIRIHVALPVVVVLLPRPQQHTAILATGMNSATPVIRSAHSGSFTTPSAVPRR
jgi:hypothetical protein